jgi:tetratricopeptide (TPR) repeat protein
LLASVRYDLGILRKATGQVEEPKRLYGQARATWTRLVKEFPSAPGYQSSLGAVLNNLANLHLKDRRELLESYRLLRQAIDHQRVALRLRPQTPTFRGFLANHFASLAASLAQQKDHVEATRAAGELCRVQQASWRDYHDAARCFARCVVLARNDVHLAESRPRVLVDDYGRQAVVLLRLAIETARSEGRTNPFVLLRARAFDAVPGRTDFRKLAAEEPGGKKP